MRAECSRPSDRQRVKGARRTRVLPTVQSGIGLQIFSFTPFTPVLFPPNLSDQCDVLVSQNVYKIVALLGCSRRTSLARTRYSLSSVLLSNIVTRFSSSSLESFSLSSSFLSRSNSTNLSFRSTAILNLSISAKQDAELFEYKKKINMDHTAAMAKITQLTRPLLLMCAIYNWEN